MALGYNPRSFGLGMVLGDDECGRGVRPMLEEDADLLSATPAQAHQKATQRYGERCSTCFTYHRGNCL